MLMQAYIQQKIDSICPNDGISFGNLNDKVTWKIKFDPSSTSSQRSQAQSYLDSFTWDATTQNDGLIMDMKSKYANDPLAKYAFSQYKTQNPSATLADFINYLASL